MYKGFQRVGRLQMCMTVFKLCITVLGKYDNLVLNYYVRTFICLTVTYLTVIHVEIIYWLPMHMYVPCMMVYHITSLSFASIRVSFYYVRWFIDISLMELMILIVHSA